MVYNLGLEQRRTSGSSCASSSTHGLGHTHWVLRDTHSQDKPRDGPGHRGRLWGPQTVCFPGAWNSADIPTWCLPEHQRLGAGSILVAKEHFPYHLCTLLLTKLLLNKNTSFNNFSVPVSLLVPKLLPDNQFHELYCPVAPLSLMPLFCFKNSKAFYIYKWIVFIICGFHETLLSF